MTVYGGAAMVFGELLQWDPTGKVSLVEATFDAVRGEGKAASDNKLDRKTELSGILRSKSSGSMALLTGGCVSIAVFRGFPRSEAQMGETKRTEGRQSH